MHVTQVLIIGSSLARMVLQRLSDVPVMPRRFPGSQMDTDQMLQLVLAFLVAPPLQSHLKPAVASCLQSYVQPQTRFVAESACHLSLLTTFGIVVLF